MGSYFKKVDNELIRELQEEDETVYVWDGSRELVSSFKKLNLSANTPNDLIGGIKKQTYVLENTNLLKYNIRLYSRDMKYVYDTYIIPKGMASNVNVEIGKQRSQIVCFDKHDFDIIVARFTPV